MKIADFIALILLGFLFAVSPVFGMAGHVCDEVNTSETGGHGDAYPCGCTCHTTQSAVVPECQDLHVESNAFVQNIISIPTPNHFPDAIERPPRLYS